MSLGNFVNPWERGGVFGQKVLSQRAVEENVLQSTSKPSLKLQGDQTIVVYTENGRLLHQDTNYYTKAIVVLSSEQLEKHDRDKQESGQIHWSTIFSDLSYSFGVYGTNYLVDGMIKLFDIAKSRNKIYKSPKNTSFHRTKGGKAIGLYPEGSTDLIINGNTISVNLNVTNKNFDRPNAVGLLNPSIHTHTNGYLGDIWQYLESRPLNNKYRRAYNWGGSDNPKEDPHETSPPSSKDWGKALYNYQEGTKIYNIVVSPNTIHLYRYRPHSKWKSSVEKIKLQFLSSFLNKIHLLFFLYFLNMSHDRFSV